MCCTRWDKKPARLPAKTKAQNIAKTTASNRQILDLMIAGEYPIALHIFNHHAYISKIAGAPVDWQAMEPVTATLHTIALAKRTPHPYAAMLLLDFVLSDKGQRVFQQVNYLPAHPKVPAKQPDLKPGGGRFNKALYITPDLQFDKGNSGLAIFRTISQMMTNSHPRVCSPCALASFGGDPRRGFFRAFVGRDRRRVALMKSADRQKILVEGAKKGR